MTYEVSTFLQAIETQGHYLVEGVVSEKLVQDLRQALEAATEKEAGYHGGSDYQDFGTVLCCAMYDRVFIDLLANDDFMAPFEAVLGDGCIIYAYQSSSQPAGGINFAGRIHVDCPRLIPGYLTNFAGFILLDDFTEANGATWYLAGSQYTETPPSRDEFYANADRLVGRAGSVWYFNPRLWHAGGRNDTDKWRHSVGLNMCRPYMKQRIDIPRLLEHEDLTGVSDKVLQKLGFLAQVPASLGEYYAPPEERKFRQKYE